VSRTSSGGGSGRTTSSASLREVGTRRHIAVRRPASSCSAETSTRTASTVELDQMRSSSLEPCAG
jgi:hypothetical protein